MEKKENRLRCCATSSVDEGERKKEKGKRKKEKVAQRLTLLVAKIDVEVYPVE